MKAWYLLYCKPRGEARAVHNLTLQEIETYLPTIGEEKRVKGQIIVKRIPLFPGYLFIYFDPQITSVARIHSTRGVGRIVGCKELMTTVDDSIIHSIKMREHKLLSELLPELKLEGADAQELPATEVEFSPGEKIRFTEGPFAELEGIFEEKNGDKRCHVLFDIMGQQKRVSVSKRIIKPI
ncbi:transcription/translation regulatory transformer protein RfaH [Shewanella violacea]|uniref:Transcription antitermination protein RfaH n=1 Tax=Shewanella violacea (strain JCM 10179 / CIP 106290 / LMG 19151 / DSS12) TaxID=637905 RepID=D4ZID6_SHEVD|nr:transcription/translation regulatory transformer protein RfaH [Shewanella violacea]BAJ01435.1 transcriptional activator rfaH, putative [Shewanella violacea DSS12]